jgi:hypothetical protein
LLPFLARTIPAAALVGFLLLLAWPLLSILGGLLGLLAAVALVSVVYVGLLLALGVPEIHAVFALVRTRLSG